MPGDSALLYSNRLLYHATMRLLYGRYFEARYTVISELIPPGSEVVDVCAGDCYLYLAFLQEKSVDYLGLDASPALIRWAQRQGAKVREFDVRESEVPEADFLVMQASLYQFLPDAEAILLKLLQAAREKVIISEPIKNASSSGTRALSWLARWLTGGRPENSSLSQTRFDLEALLELFRSFETFETCFLIPGEREAVGIFSGLNQKAPTG